MSCAQTVDFFHNRFYTIWQEGTAVCCKKRSQNVRNHNGFCRAMLRKRGLSRNAVSVRPSVCLSRSYILSKRINISSILFNVGWLHHSSFSVPNGMAIFRREPPPPNGGVECKWGRQKSQILSLSGFTACCQCCYRPGVINTRTGRRRSTVPQVVTVIARIVSGGAC